VKLFIKSLDGQETLIKTQKDPNGTVGLGRIASPDRTFAAGTANLNHGEMPSSAWIWDVSNGYRYLYEALDGNSSIPQEVWGAFAPANIDWMSPDGRYLSGNVYPADAQFFLDLGPSSSSVPEPFSAVVWLVGGDVAALIRRRQSL
jgi:hypothetical protein